MPSCTDYPRNHSMAPKLPRRDFADGATWGHRIVRELESGASGWIYWNMVLDVDGGPFLLDPDHGDAKDNYQHPVVVVDVAAGAYYPTGRGRRAGPKMTFRGDAAAVAAAAAPRPSRPRRRRDPPPRTIHVAAAAAPRPASAEDLCDI